MYFILKKIYLIHSKKSWIYIYTLFFDLNIFLLNILCTFKKGGNSKFSDTKNFFR